jgi:hypothetical protein
VDARAWPVEPQVQLERRAHRAHRVVLVGGRRAEERLDGISVERVDDAAVPAHHVAHGGAEALTARHRGHQDGDPAPLALGENFRGTRVGGHGPRKLLQVVYQLGGGIAVARVLREHSGDQPVQLLGHGGVGRAHRPGLVVEDGSQQRDLICPLKAVLAGQHLVQHHTEGPDVGAAVERLAPHLLGAHVSHRAGPLSRRGELAPRKLGDAEVQDLEHAVGGDHEVRRLDVPVDHAPLVGLGQPASRLQGEGDDLGRGHRPPLQAPRQRLALVVRHRDEELAVLRLADLVDGADVEMVERGRGLGLGAEPFLRGLLEAQVRRQELEREGALEPPALYTTPMPPRPRHSEMR